MKCNFIGCNKPQIAKGYCMTHYRRILRNGNLELRNLRGNKECVECGSKDIGGDGVFRSGKCYYCYYHVKRKYYKNAHPINKWYTDLSSVEKDDFVTEFLNKNSIFPYYDYSETRLRKSWDSLVNFDTYKILDNTFYLSKQGLEIPSFFHPEIFDVRVNGKTMIDLFNDKDELYKIVYRGLGIDYPHTSSGLRNMMKNWHGFQFAHHFRPVLAKWFAQNFCRNNFLDYSAGFGSRMIGVLSAGKQYSGIDPEIPIQKLNQKILDFLGLQANLIIGSSEIVMKTIETGNYDCIMSCPPYFDKEIYSVSGDQSIISYPHYDDWKENFLKTVIEESARILNDDGYFGMVIGNTDEHDIISDTDNIIRHYFSNVTVYNIAGTMRATSGKANKENKYKNEVLFIGRNIPLDNHTKE